MRDIIPLLAPALFDPIARNGYRIMPDDITAYRNNLAAAEEEPQGWDAQVPPRLTTTWDQTVTIDGDYQARPKA